MKRIRLFFCIAVFLSPAVLAAESLPAPDSLALVLSRSRSESDPSNALPILIQGLKTLGDPVQKKAVLLELAALEEFLGMYPEAASHYTDASYVVPGEKDQRPLLGSISCRIRSGDFERAEGELKAILLLAKNADIIAEARMLSVFVLLARGERGEAFSLAAALVESDPDAKTLLAAKLLFVAICTAKTAEIAKPFMERLSRDFPASPELKSAKSFVSGDYGLVSPYPEPYWIFATGAIDSQAGGVEARPQPDPAQIHPLADSSPIVQGNSGPKWFQTGSFTKRENSERLLAEMKKKGFKPEIHEKKTGSGLFFIVVVPADFQPDETRLKLKDSGYEAYPIFD